MLVLKMLQDSGLCQDNEGVLVRGTFLFVSGDAWELADTTLVRGGRKRLLISFLSHHNHFPFLMTLE